ncbi:uncharacterized protein LOC141816385 [Curcuma longa]|uniref:uncharacterized protein LOC141816385 n=1 Tax=Curcuma longa TaxID=136217 RepID=UPI003D9E12F0
MVLEQQSLPLPQLSSLPPQPPQLFSSLLLSSSNYIQWSGFIKTILSAYNLEDHILQDPPIKSNPPFKEWQKKDNQVFVHLLLSLDEVHKSMVACSPNAKALWDHLSALYGQTNNIGRVFELRRQMADMRKDNKTLPQLFGEFGNLWSELEVLRPPTTDPTEIIKRQNEDKVFSLLMTLGDSILNYEIGNSENAKYLS